MRLMLIDDDYSVMRSIRSVMLELGHECETFQDPHKALSVYKEKHFDVVVTGYKLEEKNGIEVLKEIRSHNSDACVILMTGYPNLVNTVSALRNGVYAFLRKPVKFNILVNLLFRIEAEKKTETA